MAPLPRITLPKPDTPEQLFGAIMVAVVLGLAAFLAIYKGLEAVFNSVRARRGPYRVEWIGCNGAGRVTGVGVGGGVMLEGEEARAVTTARDKAGAGAGDSSGDSDSGIEMDDYKLYFVIFRFVT